MNIVQLQEQLKNFSQDQLVREMQMPSGTAPQFLVLGEIMRRQKMQQDFSAQQAKGQPQSTVAEDAIAASGVPQGGIASMARAMAPQTNMAESTGVQAMATGGPVKKMNKGGTAMTDPAIRAMANRMGMSVEEYLRSVGEEQAARLEESAARRALRDRMMTMEPIGDSITLPTQADLDRQAQEEQFAFGASRPLTPPTIEGLDFVSPPMQGRLIGAQPPVAPGLPALSAADELPGPTQNLANRLAGRIGSGLGSLSARIADQMNADLARAGEEALIRNMPPGAGRSGFETGTDGRPRGVRTFTPEQLAAMEAAQPAVAPQDAGVLPPPAIAPQGDPMLSFQEEYPTGLDQGPSPGIAERIFGAPALERAGFGTSRTAAAEERALPMDTGTPLTAEDAKTAAEQAAETVRARAAEQPTPPAPPGGGEAGGGAGGMSSYEQELMNMLQRREKAAEQDKWLALAQVGLNMMSSTQPTLLGAVGEAGVKGVEAARSARDQYDKDRLDLLGALEQSRQARAAAAARAAGGASSGGIRPLSASGIMTQQKYMLDLAESRLNSLTGGMPVAQAMAMYTEAAQNDDVEAARMLEALSAANNQYKSAYQNYMDAASALGALTMTEPEVDDETRFSVVE